jgi:hypothetical protein
MKTVIWKSSEDQVIAMASQIMERCAIFIIPFVVFILSLFKILDLPIETWIDFAYWILLFIGAIIFLVNSIEGAYYLLNFKRLCEKTYVLEQYSDNDRNTDPKMQYFLRIITPNKVKRIDFDHLPTIRRHKSRPYLLVDDVPYGPFDTLSGEIPQELD